jgi:hypothetical protein
MSIDFLALTAVSLAALNWLFFQILVILRGPIARCPRCWAGRSRSALPRFQDFVFPTFITPRRCESCRRRFYVLKSTNYLRPLPAASRSFRQPALAPT